MTAPSPESLAPTGMAQFLRDARYFKRKLTISEVAAVLEGWLDAHVAERTADVEAQMAETARLGHEAYKNGSKAIAELKALRAAADAMADVLQDFVDDSGTWEEVHAKATTRLAAYRTLSPAGEGE